MTHIVTDNEFLKVPCEDVTVVEGEQIAISLFQELKRSKTGVGLAANQIGIHANVCVINVKEPIFLINPRYIEKQGEIYYDEACLSYPGKAVKTKRYHTVIIEADNFTAPVGFTSLSGKPEDILECVAVQHELDHLMGITMFDREHKQSPIISSKIGRNERVTITNGSDTKELKWKKAEAMVKSGEWEIV